MYFYFIKIKSWVVFSGVSKWKLKRKAIVNLDSNFITMSNIQGIVSKWKMPLIIQMWFYNFTVIGRGDWDLAFEMTFLDELAIKTSC